ncbi:MAG: hypothetical protein PHO01_00180 [Desulfotomaculaceae bacterium]|nr:hypothetical protein [Desulfotomaculaceae bacterium]
MIRVLLCADDTDSIDSAWGTGELVYSISETMEKRGWGKSYGVTRHQLLIHPDVPYTSHNSSMCFAADLNESDLNALTSYAIEYLFKESAPGSDPGLCIAVPDRLKQPDLLIAFGRKAKDVVVTMQEAYSLARQLGVHLSEHGGTGQGVIGALAGVGLRLSGNDGRLRGRLELISKNGIADVSSILAQTNIAQVQSQDGVLLADDELVMLGDKVKPIMMDGKFVLLVAPISAGGAGGAKWQTLTKQQLKKY